MSVLVGKVWSQKKDNGVEETSKNQLLRLDYGV